MYTYIQKYQCLTSFRYIYLCYHLHEIRLTLSAFFSCFVEIKENKSLREILYMILITGNYLNSVSRHLI